MEDFNDLFNEFFGRGKKKKDNSDDLMKNFMKNINDFKPTEDDFDKINELGEPDKTEEFEEGGITFIRKTWFTEEGQFELVEGIMPVDPTELDGFKRNFNYSNPFGNAEEHINEEKPLEEQLQEAIEAEDYEKAAELRDKINSNK